jgi:3-methyladenine DNA glycosylase/8-oxoguanine DNA glycosylase
VRKAQWLRALGEAADSGRWTRRTCAPWRPYRTWVAVLLRAVLEDETGEIAARRA